MRVHFPFWSHTRVSKYHNISQRLHQLKTFRFLSYPHNQQQQQQQQQQQAASSKQQAASSKQQAASSKQQAASSSSSSSINSEMNKSSGSRAQKIAARQRFRALIGLGACSDLSCISKAYVPCSNFNIHVV